MEEVLFNKKRTDYINHMCKLRDDLEETKTSFHSFISDHCSDIYNTHFKQYSHRLLEVHWIRNGKERITKGEVIGVEYRPEDDFGKYVTYDDMYYTNECDLYLWFDPRNDIAKHSCPKVSEITSIKDISNF